MTAAIVVILFICNGEEASGASTDSRVTVVEDSDLEARRVRTRVKKLGFGQLRESRPDPFSPECGHDRRRSQ